MKNNITTDKISSEFFDFLEQINISPVSIKNYKSDVNHFTNWLVSHIKQLGVAANNLTECLPFLNKNTGLEYKKYLLSTHAHPKTVSRQFSTLRKLAGFLTGLQIIDYDFTQSSSASDTEIDQGFHEPLLEAFVQHLQAEKASTSTIKNYTADVRHFLSWMNNHAK